MLGKKLPGLNGLRAIAALFVMFRHVFGIAEYSGDTTIVELNIFINHIGKEMVNLFFVISGFIITYILVNEVEESKTISIRNFYFKRFLRIWPLYFFLLVVVLVVLKISDVYLDFQPLTTSGVVLLIFFISNLQPFFPEAAFSVLPHYWSLAEVKREEN